jgi:sensor histidine kinase YesM
MESQFWKIKPYWACQIAGWGGFILLYTVFYYSLGMQGQHPYYFFQLFLEAGMGLLITHTMRGVIRQLQILQKDTGVQAVYLLCVTILFTGLFASSNIFLERTFGIQDLGAADIPFRNLFIRVSFSIFIYLTIWNLLYFTYHYVSRSRKEHLDKIRLETLVKELQLNTIKAHINPHFIFNALNSIRSLVDENPERARTAITELSHILRSSMASDKIETVTLAKELSIVKDYLALEQIRFEERLKVDLYIDEDTLGQPVPYMMLQTLVENAVKHGISKAVEGGHISISSDFIDDHHELVIRNTGHLNGSVNNEGFGLNSTRNRLHLLYGNQAGFEIRDIGSTEVEAKVILPVAV